MEAGSSSSSATNAPPPAGGSASKFLTNLPSRGLFSSTVPPSNLRYLEGDGGVQSVVKWLQTRRVAVTEGGMRVYICDHETEPPENQVIKTDQMNILIRSLTLKNQKGAIASSSSKKRASDRSNDARAPAKRAMTASQNSTRQGGSSSRPENFQGLKVESLRALLRERGLSVKGKKDELIERLKNASK